MVHVYLMRKLTAVLLAIVVIAPAGCFLPLPGGRTLSSRPVAEKSQGELIAPDGSYCRVSERVYAATVIGMEHTCVWQQRARRVGG